jgi:integrase/recombinase XerD
MLLKGANPKMVMMQLGHSKVETTFRYLQLSIEENKKIYDRYY